VRTLDRCERYGRIEVHAWHGLHQALGRSGEWAGFPADRDLPITPGTLIRITVERLPRDGRPGPMWLRHAPAPDQSADVDLLWKAYLRRFEQEHFHRFAYSGADRAWPGEPILCHTGLMQDAHTPVVFIDGRLDDLLSLRAWLDQESLLRGRSSLQTSIPQVGHMGGELGPLAVSLSGGGGVMALSRVITTWLRNRTGDVTLAVSVDPDGGRRIELDAKRIPDLTVQALTGLLATPPPHAVQALPDEGEPDGA
jgi:Effector Associated Constant Component 1